MKKFREKKKSSTLALHPSALEEVYAPQEARDNEGEEIVIVHIEGPLEHHRNDYFDSYDAIIERIDKAMSCDETKAVVMRIDSPGGDANGATEAHRRIQRIKSKYKKPLYAYSDESMYSAAYSIGSAADEIWVPSTGGVGSVGVICAVLDQTKANSKAGLNIKLLTTGNRKADSNPDRELTDEVLSEMQARVDYLGKVFFGTVAKSRMMTPNAVRSLQAGIFLGQSAVDSGLADFVGGWSTFINHVALENGVQQSNTESNQMTLSELKKKKAAALKAMQTAKPGAVAKAVIAYDRAATAMSEFVAKTKYTKKTEEKLEKDDEDGDEPDGDEPDGDEPDGDEESEEEESEEEESEEEESEESEEEEEPVKKSKKMSALQAQKLLSLAQKMSGATDVAEVIGALEGMGARVKKMPLIEKRLAKIESGSLRSKVEGMLAKAKSERRITPKQEQSLLSVGMKDPSWLKGYLSQQEPIVRGVEQGIDGDPALPSPTLDQQNLTIDQKNILRISAQSAGQSVEDFMKNLGKKGPF